MLNIIEAVEGGIAVTECNQPESNCALEENCLLQRNWQTVNRLLRVALASISVADMARPLTVESFKMNGAELQPVTVEPKRRYSAQTNGSE